MFARHVTQDISAYCQGELPGEAATRFAEHIISCLKCRTKFEEIKFGIKLAEQLPKFSAPDHLWNELTPMLIEGAASTRESEVGQRFWQHKAIAAAVLLLVSAAGVWWFFIHGRRAPSVESNGEPYWQVTRLGGTPRIGKEGISQNGRLAVGDWLETDGTSRAEIAVSSIGNVQINENTLVRLLETHPTEHRLELARGKLSAQIWAPPRLFFVDTPSAIAADLGCAYTLEVDDQGASKLNVTSGWVALETKDRESIVPAGASCETQPKLGPGTPYFEDSSSAFRQSLNTVDFDPDRAARSAALKVTIENARVRDTLTLWHLLNRVDGDDRVQVYEKMVALAPPPSGVTREGVLQLDDNMLEIWRRELESTWMGASTKVPKPIAETYWRLKNGVSRRLRDMAPK